MAVHQRQWVAISPSSATQPSSPESSSSSSSHHQQQQSPDCLFWCQRILLTDKMRAFLFLWIFVLLVLHVASGAGGRRNQHQNDGTSLSATQSPSSPSDALMPCSRVCQCEAGAVDCSNRGLTQVPLDLPKDADKM